MSGKLVRMRAAGLGSVLAAPHAISPDLFAALSPVLVVAVPVLAAWLMILTVLVALRLRALRNGDEPVFRRLPGGRVRFTWGVPQAFGEAQRRLSADVDTHPIRRT